MYNLRLTPTVILLLTGLHCFSQHDEIKADVYDYREYNISIPVKEQKEKFPFRNIYVYDIRHDTSCLGIHTKATTNQMTVLNPKAGLVKEIRNYYLSLIDSASGNNDNPELHCFIKKLILSDHIYFDPSHDQRMIEKKYDAMKMSGAIYTAEFYSLQDDLYTPICRFDSLVVGSKSTYRFADEYLSVILMASLRKAAHLSGTEKLKNGKHLTREAVDAYNNQRFNIPILTAVPVKGIFLTFKDFLNNTPSSSEFTVEKNRTGDFLYVKNTKGQDELLRDLWGYCDGKDYYIFSANNYFKLYRTGNGFKVYGAKDFTGSRTLRMNFSMMDAINPNSNLAKGGTANKYYLIKHYYLLDMETGELF